MLEAKKKVEKQGQNAKKNTSDWNDFSFLSVRW